MQAAMQYAFAMLATTSKANYKELTHSAEYGTQALAPTGATNFSRQI